MKLLGIEFGKKPKAKEAFFDSSSWNQVNVFDWSYNGEKNLGEIGPIKNYSIDYPRLRARSWQSYLESEITQTVINKYTTWVIGSGLKLQSEPSVDVLKSLGLDIDVDLFNRIVEPRWRLFNDTKQADLADNRTLNQIAAEAFKASKIGGDVLIILSYKKGVGIKVQLVDGAHVQQPLGTKYYTDAKAKGNTIREGIEYDKYGKHVAYYVVKNGFPIDYDRVECYGAKSGKRMAYLVYGSKYRIDSVRGVPLFVSVFETLAKLERYKEATVGSAEERQKIAFSIEHNVNSNGENPFNRMLARAVNADAEDDLPVDINGTELANTVSATTNKQAVNMPTGATLKMLESKNELYFRDFYTINIDLVCASINMPPEVALSKYDSNFSASRAALKDWEHGLKTSRNSFAYQFYTPIYELFLDVMALENQLTIPGYLVALSKKDVVALDAYRYHRFVGPSVPHIDPVKEVEAERRKLGASFDHLPLTSLENSIEVLGGGDVSSVFKRIADELLKAKESGLDNEEDQPPTK